MKTLLLFLLLSSVSSAGEYSRSIVDIPGNAATASALAANGSNCTAGNYPLGVDASGAVESCTAAGGGSSISQLDTEVKVTDAGDGYITATEDGTEIMRITGGRVGIGTSAPSATLAITEATTQYPMTLKTDTARTFTASAPNGAVTFLSKFTGQGSAWQTGSLIWGYLAAYTAGGSRFSFAPTDSDGNDTALLTLTGGGNVGISAINPTSKFDVLNGSVTIRGTGAELSVGATVYINYTPTTQGGLLMKSPNGTIWNCGPANTTGAWTCGAY